MSCSPQRCRSRGRLLPYLRACRASHVNSRRKHSNRNYQHQKSRIMEYYRNNQINLDLIGGREENIDV
jgi:hypothetical protein